MKILAVAAAAVVSAGLALCRPASSQAAPSALPGPDGGARTSIAVSTAPADVPTLHLEASVTGRVPFDTARATLFVERDGVSPVEPTREVNRVLTALLAEARALKGIEARTGAYTTQPSFDRGGKVSGYRVRAELVVESRDFGLFSDALGKLASRAPIAHVQYEVSPQARAAEEERLLKDAAEAFRRKAAAGARALGFPRYVLLDLQLGGSGPPQPRSFQATMGVAIAAAEMGPPPVSPETATITVTLSGRIRLEN